jgi:nicotinate dehydrogenase subunit A
MIGGPGAPTMARAGANREAAMPRFELHVNGDASTVEVGDPNEPLLYVLRDTLGLTGAKFGCGLGQCGTCTVLIDGEPVRSCVVPVSRAAQRKVTTIEGLGSAEKPHPLQSAFIAEQAAQCGYCTPGMVMTCAALLAKKPNATLQEAKDALAGNLCRCGAHQRVLNAVMRVAGRAAT